MSYQTNNLNALRAEANKLKARLEAIKKDYASGLSADSEERATELENADTLREIERTTFESLQAVNIKIAQLTGEDQAV